MDISSVSKLLEKLKKALDPRQELQQVMNKAGEWLVRAEKRDSRIKNHTKIYYRELKSSNNIGVIVKNNYVSLWKDQGTQERYRKSMNYARTGKMPAKPFWYRTYELEEDDIYDLILSEYRANLEESVN